MIIFRRLKSSLRLRHFRGRGVHSPMAYALVREVFLSANPQEVKVYKYLRMKGLGEKLAHELQAVSEKKSNYKMEFYFSSDSLDAIGSEQMTISCVLNPLASRRRYATCKRLVQQHTGMSIDRGGYILLFNDSDFRKQHYRL